MSQTETPKGPCPQCAAKGRACSTPRAQGECCCGPECACGPDCSCPPDCGCPGASVQRS